MDGSICEEESLSAVSACTLCHYSVQAQCLSTFPWEGEPSRITLEWVQLSTASHLYASAST